MSRKSDTKNRLRGFVFAAFIAVSLYFLAFFFLSRTEHEMCQVETVQVEPSHQSIMYVYASCGDFVLEPVLLRDVTAEEVIQMRDTLLTDEPVTITTVGYRISPLDIYPSIIAVR